MSKVILALFLTLLFSCPVLAQTESVSPPPELRRQGVMDMPTDYTQEAAARLVKLNLITVEQAAPENWTKEIPLVEAARIFTQAAQLLKRPPLTPSAKTELTRITFAHWLDSLIGSPALPIPPREVEKSIAKRDSSDNGTQTRARIKHPELFKLFRDLPNETDRAIVNRLVWWLILRPHKSSLH